jgi:hypothetical protein
MIFSEDEVREIVRLLDEPCWSCFGGEGRFAVKRDDDNKCAICNGSGYTLTAAGAALLEFIRRHGGQGGKK